MTTFILAGGCFWCLDAAYRQLRGVAKVESGYVGGKGPATYARVSTGQTDYAEAVRVTFDENVIPKETILDIFFLIHDPTTLNRQGADVGTQYRSALFYADKTQQSTFQAALIRAQKLWHDPIVTEITPLEKFHPAETEHQDYFHKNPGSGYCSVVIAPKIAKARHKYTKWFKEEQ